MKIKLIIWDLDETLWEGTLDEREVTIKTQFVQFIKKLNDRGILNSICSKNDFDNARRKLEDFGIWDEFIMPRIEWTSKGNVVKDLISDFQLRSENVLFIDDNLMNLNEVLFYNKGINVLNIEDATLEILLNDIILSTDMDQRKRFNQYKVLENKNIDKNKFQDNYDFLRNSNIKIKIHQDCMIYVDRIHELMNRTNQLNFTKQRLSKEEIKILLDNKEFYSFVVFANDDYGDYGLIGFVSLNTTNNSLAHFVFSCRTLNMGIEQYIWSKLNFPELKIVGDVTTKLDSNSSPDWIKEDNEEANVTNEKAKNRILLIGGCDLYQLKHYLTYSGEIDTYFNCPSLRYNAELHRDSINFIYNSKYLDEESQNIIIDYFPLADKSFFSVPNFNNYDIIIYSPLIDYVQNQYRFQNSEIKISWGDYTQNTKDCEYEIRTFTKNGIEKDRINQFITNFTSIGALDEDDFLFLLKKIYGTFKGTLVLLNGATKFYPESDLKYVEQHKKLNHVLQEFSLSLDTKPIIIDINEIISSMSDFTNSIRHYKKHIYQMISLKIVDELNNIKESRLKYSKINYYKNMVYKIISKIKRI